MPVMDKNGEQINVGDTVSSKSCGGKPEDAEKKGVKHPPKVLFEDQHGAWCVSPGIYTWKGRVVSENHYLILYKIDRMNEDLLHAVDNGYAFRHRGSWPRKVLCSRGRSRFAPTDCHLRFCCTDIIPGIAPMRKTMVLSGRVTATTAG